MPIDFSSALDPYNATTLGLTFNTNIAFYTQEDTDDFTEEMKVLFRDQISPYSEEIFGDEALVPKVKFSHFGVEIGKKFHRGHVHFVAEIKHRVPRYSAEKLVKRFVAVLNRLYPRSKGWYGHFERESTRNANYSNKNSRALENYKVENDPEYREELERLSDPRKMFSTYHNGKVVKKLAYSMQDLQESLAEIEGEQ